MEALFLGAAGVPRSLGTRDSPLHARARALAALLALLSGGCGFGATLGTEERGSGRCTECVGEDGGTVAPPVPDGTTVAFLETSVPMEPAFILRGTIPVPPQTLPRPDNRNPFTLLDYDGSAVETQVQLVTRYPNAADGADVVEVLGLVHRDPMVGAGTRARYEVLQAPGIALPSAQGADIADLVTTANVPANVQALIANPLSVEIATYDCYGHKYVCRPLDRSGDYELMRRGRVQTELRVYQTMRPEPPVLGPAGTLPHFFGVHAYVSTFTGHEILGLDLRFNNGQCGRDPNTDLDQPLDKVYFEKLEIALPAGWHLLQDFEDPFFGGVVDQGDRHVHDLVQPNPDGRMHVMRWQGQFHRRLMIVSTADRDRARAYLDGIGQGFCVRGTDPLMGHELWSWWNKGTSRYFPQRYQLPSLDHVSGPLRAALSADHDRLQAHLVNGTGDGDYPVQSGVLGWGHPYGVSYGGMTSGNEIFCWDGVGVAAASSIRGYRAYEAYHRMHTDRMPTAFYELDGEPTSVERWLVNGTYVPFSHYLVPFQGSSYPDPFGLGDAPRFQINFVQQNGLAPAYEGAHLGFDPHDFQHFIRYTRSAKVLAWLGNDSLAKDDLRMQAENFHLSFHPYRNDPYGATQFGGMLAMQQYVAAHPSIGCPFGRGEAWGVDCALAAYSFSDTTWRAAKRPWFARIAELVLNGQGQCNGFIQSFVSDKAVDGLYRARQVIEQSITENTLMGLRETVFRGVDPGHADMVRDVLVNSLYAFVGEMAWFPEQGGPWRYTGIAPLNLALPIWCRRSQMPPDAWSAGDIDTYQDWSSFAYGYELTGDPVFLEYALKQLYGATNLLNRLRSEGFENLENRSALLALAQHLAGEI